jgi:hypothetical protein
MSDDICIYMWISSEWVSEWVSEWLLFNVNSAIFQLYHAENKLISNEMHGDEVRFLCTRPTRLTEFS